MLCVRVAREDLGGAYIARGWVWPAMALVRILSLCSVLLVARQVLAQSGEPAEQPLVEQPLELERGELRGIQVQAEIM